MSLVFVCPGHGMAVGNNQLALYAPLLSTVPPNDPAQSTLTLLQAISGAIGWWDASFPGGLLGPANTPVTVWNSSGIALIDLSGNGRNLAPFSSPAAWKPPQGSAHLSGLLGGAGYPVNATQSLQPTLDADCGWQRPGLAQGVLSSWTWYLVWSRPNWRQGTAFDESPIALMTVGSQVVLQVDSRGGAGRLILFPGAGQIVVKSNMVRRHTHSIIIRYSPASGTDLWVDETQVAWSVPWTPETLSGPVILLHDGMPHGAAQCWLHEAAEWDRALSNSEVGVAVSYAGRWARGPRKGLYFIVNGQSNAVNYSLNDGAAAVLARGVAWYLGALAYNVLATTGSSTNFTMQSGHGIYFVASAGYPGSFVMDPGDGSSPSGWGLGTDGLAVEQAIAGLPAEDLIDMCAIIWPWNETDSLRQYSEFQKYEAAAVRFLSLLREMLGDTSHRIPLVWWNAIPYGSADGMTMHRQVVQEIASNPIQNVIIGNPQTSDSNPRGSFWDPTTGIVSGGDFGHRDSADNLRFAMLAAPVAARALMSRGYTDSIAFVPQVISKIGGPSISYSYRESSTTVIITVVHDGGNDLKVPRLARNGMGFSVMDGGSPGNAGTIVNAVACERIDATHLRVVLASPLQSPSSACRLFYPYGSFQIGRGNAVTDNCAGVPMPSGWDASADLGTNWALDYPLAAMPSGVQLSDMPS